MLIIISEIIGSYCRIPSITKHPNPNAQHWDSNADEYSANSTNFLVVPPSLVNMNWVENPGR